MAADATWILSAQHFFTKSAQRRIRPCKDWNWEWPECSNHSLWFINTKILPNNFLQDLLLYHYWRYHCRRGIKTILVPNHIFDGGITGISLLVHESYGYNLGWLFYYSTFALIAVSYFSIGQRFAFAYHSECCFIGYCIIINSGLSHHNSTSLLILYLVEPLGIGIGLLMRTGAALDSIEVLAVYIKTSFTITQIILGINIIIFTIAGFSLWCRNGTLFNTYLFYGHPLYWLCGRRPPGLYRFYHCVQEIVKQ